MADRTDYFQGTKVIKSIKIGHIFRWLPTKRHYTHLIRKKPARFIIHTPQACHTTFLWEVRFRHSRSILLVFGEHLRLHISGRAHDTPKMSTTQIIRLETNYHQIEDMYWFTSTALSFFLDLSPFFFQFCSTIKLLLRNPTMSGHALFWSRLKNVLEISILINCCLLAVYQLRVVVWCRFGCIIFYFLNCHVSHIFGLSGQYNTLL